MIGLTISNPSSKDIRTKRRRGGGGTRSTQTESRILLIDYK
jgi:hypothetical protein